MPCLLEAWYRPSALNDLGAMMAAGGALPGAVPALHGRLLLDNLTICIEWMVDGIDAEWVDQHGTEGEQRPQNGVEEQGEDRQVPTKVLDPCDVNS